MSIADQCPRGAYQDAAFNRCMSCPIGSYNNESGQPVCKNCPANYSTRKIGRIMPAECKRKNILNSYVICHLI